MNSITNLHQGQNKVIVSMGYDHIETNITLTSGHGTILPDPSVVGPYNIVWWNASDYINPTDDPFVEVTRCIAKMNDTLVVIRSQQQTLASPKNIFGKLYNMTPLPYNNLETLSYYNLPQPHGASSHTGTIGDHTTNLSNVGSNTHTAIDTAIGTTLPGLVTTHANLGTAHGSTSAATVSTIMQRDTAGRAQAVAPSAASDIAIKSTVDTVQTNLNTHAGLATTHLVSGAIVGTTDSQSLTNKTITDSTNNVMAKSLKSSSTTIDVSAAAAPSANQVLTATSSTTATWQTPSAAPTAISSLAPEIIYSNDIGKNWKDLGVINSYTVYSNIIYIGNGMAIVVDLSGKIYKTYDYGKTWSNVSTVPGGSTSSIAYLGDGIVIANGGNYIYRSTDYGVTWTNVASLSTNTFNTMIYIGNGIALTGLLNGHVERSTDYGVTWTELTPTGTTGVYSILYHDNGIVTLADSNTHIFRSTNYGATWSDLGAVLSPPFSSVGAYLGKGISLVPDSSGNIWRSTNYGLTWTNIGFVSASIAVIAYFGNGISITVGTDGHVWKSIDYGLTWADTGSTVGTSIKYATAYIGNGVTLLADSDSHIWRSDVALKLNETSVSSPVGILGNPTGTILPYAGLVAPSGYLQCDGSAVSRTTYSNLFTAIVPSLGTFTVTIATPAVISKTAHGLSIDHAFYVTTTGALPTGMTVNTLYYVIAAGFTASSFQFSATRSGIAINTSGSQSGTHSFNFAPYGIGDGTTTFNVPDTRGRMPLGAGPGAGLTSRPLGTNGGVETHTHGTSSGGPNSVGSPSVSWYITNTNSMNPFVVFNYIIKT